MCTEDFYSLYFFVSQAKFLLVIFFVAIFIRNSVPLNHLFALPCLLISGPMEQLSAEFLFFKVSNATVTNQNCFEIDGSDSLQTF